MSEAETLAAESAVTLVNIYSHRSKQDVDRYVHSGAKKVFLYATTRATTTAAAKPVVYAAIGRIPKAPMVAYAAGAAAEAAALPATLAGQACGVYADHISGGTGASGSVKISVEYAGGISAGAAVGAAFGGPLGAASGAAAGAVGITIHKTFDSIASLAQGIICNGENADVELLATLRLQKVYSANDVAQFFELLRIWKGWQSNYGGAECTGASVARRADAEAAAMQELVEIGERRGCRDLWDQFFKRFKEVREENGWLENYGWFVTTTSANRKRQQAEDEAWYKLRQEFAPMVF